MRGAGKSLAASWFDLATSSAELMQGSAEVIARRTGAMAAAGPNPSPAQEREMKRMVDEKVHASVESFASMAVTATSAWQTMLMGSIFAGRSPTATQVQRAAASVLASGIAPYKKAVRSNVKRLRK